MEEMGNTRSVWAQDARLRKIVQLLCKSFENSGNREFL